MFALFRQRYGPPFNEVAKALPGILPEDANLGPMMSWQKYIDESICAVKSGDLLAAEDCLKLALQFSKQNYGRNDYRLSIVLSLLGHTYFYNQDFDRAALLLEQSLKLHLDSQLPDNPCLVMDLYCLGQLKRARGRQLDVCKLYAEVLYRLKATKTKSGDLVRAIEVFQRLLGEYRAQLSAVDRAALDRAVVVDAPKQQAYKQDMQPPATAPRNASPPVPAPSPAPAPSLSPSPAPVEAVDVVLSPVIQPSLSDSSGLCDSTAAVADEAAIDGQALVAPVVALEALQELWRKQLDTGLACLQADDDEREQLVSAYLNLESAFRLARSVFSDSDKRFLVTIKALADSSAKLRMFNQSEALYRHAIVLSQRNVEDAEPRASTLRLHLALLYCDCDLFKASKTILDDEGAADGAVPVELSKRISTARDQIRTFEVATDFINQAQAAEKDGDYEKAARLANNAMSQMKQSFPPNHGELSGMLRYRARVLKLLQRQEQALELSERATRIERALDAMAADWLKLTDDLPRAEITVVSV